MRANSRPREIGVVEVHAVCIVQVQDEEETKDTSRRYNAAGAGLSTTNPHNDLGLCSLALAILAPPARRRATPPPTTQIISNRPGGLLREARPPLLRGAHGAVRHPCSFAVEVAAEEEMAEEVAEWAGRLLPARSGRVYA